MTTIKRIALVLTIIGAINWGLIGLFQFDLVAAIFGGQDGFWARVVYTLVGLSGLICLSYLFDSNEEVNTKTDRQEYGKLNYGTEFGEENDVTYVGRMTNDNDNNNNNNNNNI